MLPTPKIIAIDDRQDELEALTASLAKIGVSCLGVKYSSEDGISDKFPDVRVIFFDLHLLGSGIGTRSTHFNQILGCLEQISPQGPYVIIVWSQQAHEADEGAEGEGLQEYLTRRLDPKFPKPYGVLKLPKVEHIERDATGASYIADPHKLKLRIEELLAGHPQAKALLVWEKALLSAASGTVSQVIELSDGDPGQLKSVMASLARASVGAKNIDQDRFYALNEVLIPILSDRLSFLGSEKGDQEIWSAAFSSGDADSLQSEQCAKINKFINISESVDNVLPQDRGALFYLDSLTESETQFVEDLFGLSIGEVITRCFAMKSLKSFEGARWVLLQGQAACDYAQRKPQALTYFLGLESSPDAMRNPKNGDIPYPDSLWISPDFLISGSIKKLLFNAGAMIVLPRSALPNARVIYRMREQILNDLLFKLRGHQSRPGIIYL